VNSAHRPRAEPAFAKDRSPKHSGAFALPESFADDCPRSAAMVSGAPRQEHDGTGVANPAGAPSR